jgi:hypothetical protein
VSAPKVKWQEPPSVDRGGLNRGQSKWAVLLRALEERPNEWALISEGSSLTTSSFRNPSTSTNRALVRAGVDVSRYEFTQRAVVAGGRARHDVYARYIGNGAS